jgi:hypothetical protein
VVLCGVESSRLRKAAVLEPHEGDTGPRRGGTVRPAAGRPRVQPGGQRIGIRRVLIGRDGHRHPSLVVTGDHGRPACAGGIREQAEETGEPRLRVGVGGQDVERPGQQDSLPVGQLVGRPPVTGPAFREPGRRRDRWRRGRGSAASLLGHPDLGLRGLLVMKAWPGGRPLLHTRGSRSCRPLTDTRYPPGSTPQRPRKYPSAD